MDVHRRITINGVECALYLTSAVRGRLLRYETNPGKPPTQHFVQVLEISLSKVGLEEVFDEKTQLQS